MKTPDLNNLISSFKQSIQPKTPSLSDARNSLLPIQANNTQSSDYDYWLPSKSYCLTERRMFREFHQVWKTAVANRPEKTLQDAELSVREYFEFARKHKYGLFRRRSFFRFRDHLLKEKHLQPKTVGKRLTFLRSMLQAAEDEEVFPANPVRSIRIPTPKNRAPSRIPYTLLELDTFFQSPAYSRSERTKGSAGEAIFWLPLIALFTGMRIEEIAQLRGSHLQEEEGVWHFYVTSDDGGSLKTSASARRIPIHPELIQCRLMEYKAHICSDPRDYLFPQLKTDCFSKRSGNFSKYFTRYLRKTAGINDKRLVFHSFRHTFRKACRNAELDEEIADALMGHSGASTGRHYGGYFPIVPLAKAIAKIHYSGLSLPRWDG